LQSQSPKVEPAGLAAQAEPWHPNFRPSDRKADGTMDINTIAKIFLAAMFSPPGIANFVVSTVLKKRLHATAAAFIASAALVFMNSKGLATIPRGQYVTVIICTVIAMMIVAHVAFTIGEKVIRKK
jgi:hypothetical protein